MILSVHRSDDAERPVLDQLPREGGVEADASAFGSLRYMDVWSKHSRNYKFQKETLSNVIYRLVKAKQWRSQDRTGPVAAVVFSHGHLIEAGRATLVF